MHLGSSHDQQLRGCRVGLFPLEGIPQEDCQYYAPFSIAWSRIINGGILVEYFVIGII